MRRAELLQDKAAIREAERQAYEDQAIGVADRIRRREALLRARLPAARAEAKDPGVEAAAQTEETKDPRLYNPEMDRQIKLLELQLAKDALAAKKAVGPAVSWGASSSDAPL